MTHRHQILVIDDDDAQVRLLTQVIGRTFGARVDMTAMTDAPEALGWIEKNHSDLVITDLDMPGVSGLEILRAAKRRNPAAQVVLVTGMSSQSALHDALESGAADYLLKPLDAKALVEVIEQAIGRIERWRYALAQTAATAPAPLDAARV